MSWLASNMLLLIRVQSDCLLLESKDLPAALQWTEGKNKTLCYFCLPSCIYQRLRTAGKQNIAVLQTCTFTTLRFCDCGKRTPMVFQSFSHVCQRQTFFKERFSDVLGCVYLRFGYLGCNSSEESVSSTVWKIWFSNVIHFNIIFGVSQMWPRKKNVPNIWTSEPQLSFRGIFPWFLICNSMCPKYFTPPPHTHIHKIFTDILKTISWVLEMLVGFSKVEDTIEPAV